MGKQQSYNWVKQLSVPNVKGKSSCSLIPILYISSELGFLCPYMAVLKVEALFFTFPCLLTLVRFDVELYMYLNQTEIVIQTLNNIVLRIMSKVRSSLAIKLGLNPYKKILLFSVALPTLILPSDPNRLYLIMCWSVTLPKFPQKEKLKLFCPLSSQLCKLISMQKNDSKLIERHFHCLN